MACSSGDATVSAMVFGFAPGYVARTTMVGGTTSGYSLIGNRHMAINPRMKMTVESTPANIGRRIKKSEKFIAFEWFAAADVGRPGSQAFSSGASALRVPPFVVHRLAKLVRCPFACSYWIV